MKPLKIGAVARAAEGGVETIRYYERQGLLAQAERRPSGYRQYDEAVVARLRFIRQTKDLGFTLAEIRELLRLWFDTATRCEHVRTLAARKITEIDTKIASLKSMKRALGRVLKDCNRNETLAACPLLGPLNDDPD